jgi:hypothetical protein
MRQLDADHVYLAEEIRNIETEIEHFNTAIGQGFWRPFQALKDRKTQWRFFLGGMLFVCQNGTLSLPIPFKTEAIY